MKIGTIIPALAMCAAMGMGSAASADDYDIDPAHSGVNFHVRHQGVSWIPGRFNRFSGEIRLDSADPGKSSIKMTIDPDSVDTNNEKRDHHLKSPDFFNTPQYPKIEFASTAVEPSRDGYQVTGDLTLHGERRPVTFVLKGGKLARNKKGEPCTGYTTQFKVRRSDYGIGGKFPEKFISDEILVTITVEVVKSGS